MAGELEAIKARLGEHNVTDAEIGKLVGVAVNSGAEPQALAEVLQAAYAKIGNKDIVIDQPKAIVAEKRMPSEALADAKTLLAKKKALTAGDEEKKGSVTKRLKRVKNKPAQEKEAEKLAAKEAKKLAKDAKKKKKDKKGLSDIAKDEKKAVDKSAKTDKELAKLKKKDGKDEKDGKDGQEPKTAAAKEKQMQEKLAKLKTSGLDIKEQGASWMMKVQDANGKDVLVDVTADIEKLRSINGKIDAANQEIDKQNKSPAANVGITPQVTAADGKDIKGQKVADAPAVPQPTVDAVKREAFAATLAEAKAADGVTPKFSEKDIKMLSEYALNRFKDDKILKKLKEKEKEESKKEHGDKPMSLATPTQVVR